MTFKVLVVDDSMFFRRRLTEIINADPNLSVVDVAENGMEAVIKTAKIKPDVITMDIEMPVMNGLVAVKQIMEKTPTPILMFSSLTYSDAKATLDALEAGALDFLPKNFEQISQQREGAISALQKRIYNLAARKIPPNQAKLNSQIQAEVLNDNLTKNLLAPSFQRQSKKFKASGKNYQIVAIGTSTGGPVALQKILTALPANFPYPIILIQHMPATFTLAFAERLDKICKIQVKEAKDGDIVKESTAYLAPGGTQLLFKKRGSQTIIKIETDDSNTSSNYRPSVDVTFASLANVYASQVLSIILTGMGTDGLKGANLLKQNGATVWAQDAESSVVYGMPKVVTKAGIATQSLALNSIARCILLELKLAP